MCCNKRRQQRLQQQALLQHNYPANYRTGGCCGARRQRRLLRELENANQPSFQTLEVTELRQQELSWAQVREYRSPMAGLIAVGIAIGAEKLGRKISEKRIERKDRKAAEQREAIYGPGESSSSSSSGNAAAQSKISRRPDGRGRKNEEAKRENEQGERRSSVSSERTLLPEQPPPRYEDVVQGDATRAPPYSS